MLNPADFLHRHATPISKLSKALIKETSEFEKTVWFLQFFAHTKSISMSTIIKESEMDDTIRDLKQPIRKGYIPKEKKDLTQFHKIFDELAISDEQLVMKSHEEEKIILPESFWDIAITKAHQGAHPGMSSMKRRIRSHFWLPKLNQKLEDLVNSCKECQLFTHKNTKEPLISHNTNKEAWQDVSIELFGPVPDQKHVLVILDKMSRFPAAEVVLSTAAKPIIKALSDIYTSFGQPKLHQTDNGLPFDSKASNKFSDVNAIQHKRTLPYHPQGNLAETFMKPLEKTMKSANLNKGDKEEALNGLLAQYRATPHLATGNIMFRSGYRRDFPHRATSESEITETIRHNEKQRKHCEQTVNKLTHRSRTNYKVGDQVYTRNMTKRNST